MQAKWNRICLAVLLCGVMFLAACASTIEDRREERADAFARMTPQQQNLILQGRIAEGMNKDAVYIAFGSPERILQERLNGVSTESWVYGRVETYTSPVFYAGSLYGFGPYGYGPYFYPGYYSSSVSVMRDTFVIYFNKSGKVKGWREL